MTTSCKICGNAGGNRIHRAREMMFGTREEFDYVECVNCGTLQIREIPDLAKYYPDEYYSFSQPGHQLSDLIKSRLTARLGARYLISKKGVIGRLLVARKKWVTEYFPFFLTEPSLNLDFGSRILDVGSGGGNLLRLMSYFGFQNLTGADAFIDKDHELPGPVRIVKRTLQEIDGLYDLVMLHHSLEHFPDPQSALREVSRLLPADRFAIIRIPLKSHAWEVYGTNWVQLDPPRHLFIFTEESFRQMATDAGFEVTNVIYDSISFQFYGSEQYARDIPMNDPRAFRGDFDASIFTARQMQDWEEESRLLNEQGRGDQACFFLRRR